MTAVCLQVLSIAVPLSFIVTHLLATRDKADFTQAIMCKSLKHMYVRSYLPEVW